MSKCGRTTFVRQFLRVSDPEKRLPLSEEEVDAMDSATNQTFIYDVIRCARFANGTRIPTDRLKPAALEESRFLEHNYQEFIGNDNFLGICLQF